MKKEPFNIRIVCSSLLFLSNLAEANMAPSLSNLKSGPSCAQGCSASKIESLRPLKPLKPTPSNSTELLIFVSHSMPISVLKQLSADAQKIKGRLIMRGLIQDSMSETIKFLQQHKIAVDIDPPLFEAFKITQVPTFVHCKVYQQQPQISEHDQISGNVSLFYALEKFHQEGTLKGVEHFLKYWKAEN